MAPTHALFRSRWNQCQVTLEVIVCFVSTSAAYHLPDSNSSGNQTDNIHWVQATTGLLGGPKSPSRRATTSHKSSEFHLFGLPRKNLAGKWFAKEANVKSCRLLAKGDWHRLLQWRDASLGVRWVKCRFTGDKLLDPPSCLQLLNNIQYLPLQPISGNRLFMQNLKTHYCWQF